MVNEEIKTVRLTLQKKDGPTARKPGLTFVRKHEVGALGDGFVAGAGDTDVGPSRTRIARSKRRPGREAVAYHEAGHIVAAFDQNLRLISASIVPTRDFDGYVQPAGIMVPRGDLRPFVEMELILLLAGPLAEHAFVGRDVGDRSDDIHAQALLDALNPDPEVMEAHLGYLMTRVKHMLTHYWDLVAAFAEQLLARETLDGDEIVKVAVDADWELPPSWKSENDEELDTELEGLSGAGRDGHIESVREWLERRALYEVSDVGR
jgi:hypothetical protein